MAARSGGIGHRISGPARKPDPRTDRSSKRNGAGGGRSPVNTCAGSAALPPPAPASRHAASAAVAESVEVAALAGLAAGYVLDRRFDLGTQDA